MLVFCFSYVLFFIENFFLKWFYVVYVDCNDFKKNN